MIGVFGGTFDPVHFGHLRTAFELSDRLQLERTLLVPSHTPPHRQTPVASAQQRWQMLQLALSGDPCLEADARELERAGPSYMVDTLTTIRTEVGASPVCLLLGADVFVGLAQWHQWLRLFELAHIVVARRPGHALKVEGRLVDELSRRQVEQPSDLVCQAAGNVLQLELTQMEISSSDIRRQMKGGLLPRYLTPDAVVDYLAVEGLYR